MKWQSLILCSALLICAGTFAQGRKDLDQEFFPVEVDGKWGFIDRTGELQVAPRFSEVDEFGELSNGFSIAAIDDRWGFIDDQGAWIVEPRFSLAIDCSDELAAVEMGEGKWRFTNHKGDFVDRNSYENVYCFREGPTDTYDYLNVTELGPAAAVVTSGDDMWTYLDVRHSKLLPVRDHYPEGFNEGLTPMRAGNLWGFVDESGAFVVHPRFDEAHGFSEGLAAIRLGDRWGYADKTGAIVIKPQFNWALGFSEGLGGVELDGKFGFIDHDGNFVVAPSFKDVRVFSEGMAAVRISDKWGYIDRQGSMAVQPRFDNDALPFRSGIAQVRLSGGYLGYINQSGEYVWKPTR